MERKGKERNARQGLGLGLGMERQGNTMKGNARHGKAKESQDNRLR
jgi:hypothetical protein